jgi:hypothetical protein
MKPTGWQPHTGRGFILVGENGRRSSPPITPRVKGDYKIGEIAQATRRPNAASATLQGDTSSSTGHRWAADRALTAHNH